MGRPLLELNGLGRRFATGEQEIAVLKEVNLTINAGELVAIIGASGSGKSTLMNILGCLDRPSEGSYRINGEQTGTLSGDELARLRREYFGFIFQRYHLMPHLSATQNAEIPAVYAGVPKEERRSRAREILCRLGLEERCEHRPNQLSGGQQQRVSIARALMNGGEVILADEPTGALDSKSGQEMMALLHELHDAGHTIILVTHDAQVASHAERIIEISDGRIVSDRPNPAAAPRQSRQPLDKAPVRREASLFAATWGRFAEAFKMALIAMASHRMRTLLTMLGIVIGITSVVSVVALGQGARQKVINDISAMGTNVIDISPGKDWGDEDAASIQTLVLADLEALKVQVYVDSATPVLSDSQLLRYHNVTASAQVKGVGEQYFRVRGYEFEKGSGFSAEDARLQAQVVVIDKNTSKKFFAQEEPIGKVLLVGSLPCRVIGVTKEKEGPFGNNQNLEVWIPSSAAMARLLGQQYLNSITVRVRDGISNQIAEQSIVKLLTQRHGRKDFFTSSSDTIMKTVNKTTQTLALMISAIALISLVVGGIGVMNIMLVSVTERTHEIGIRMAVGARQEDIMQQFLIESVLVCLVGGMIGILLSYGVGTVFSVFVKSFAMKFSLVSVVSAFLCSTLIGVVFGFLPARNAARLDPIDALARE
ncbi:macrolide export ATP-binding/permease protein MacB [Geomonas limicola]|uniref:Macrolide export ATP-binding/permease protein MacB n=1 Tax=Geomonas limicola TaxID=2740186 RepID=A0A6V8N7Y0_9BACT|nr:MacB family efflux pump subunit [Geomonas limicola]GFO68611.1 macrolide export ATP-binding/permease protein MacB [Geomonas limicola]